MEPFLRWQHHLLLQQIGEFVETGCDVRMVFVVSTFLKSERVLVERVGFFVFTSPRASERDHVQKAHPSSPAYLLTQKWSIFSLFAQFQAELYPLGTRTNLFWSGRIRADGVGSNRRARSVFQTAHQVYRIDLRHLPPKLVWQSGRCRRRPDLRDFWSRFSHSLKPLDSPPLK